MTIPFSDSDSLCNAALLYLCCPLLDRESHLCKCTKPSRVFINTRKALEHNVPTTSSLMGCGLVFVEGVRVRTGLMDERT
jgi:hypothetical protein